MKTYRITLKHDTGSTRLTVHADNATRAIQSACASERAPWRAVAGVERIDFTGYGCLGVLEDHKRIIREIGKDGR